MADDVRRAIRRVIIFREMDRAIFGGSGIPHIIDQMREQLGGDPGEMSTRIRIWPSNKTADGLEIQIVCNSAIMRDWRSHIAASMKRSLELAEGQMGLDQMNHGIGKVDNAG